MRPKRPASPTTRSSQRKRPSPDIGKVSTEQLFSNLNGIERRAFEELVARNPEGQAILERTITTQPADGAIVLLGLVKRLRILILGWFVDDLQARRFAEHLVGRFDRDGLVELSVHGYRVRAIDRHPHTRDTGAERRMVHDLAALIFHLHLF